MTKQSDTFRTPPSLFKELDSVFNFFWDACCDKDNCLVKRQKDYLACGWGNDYLTINLTEKRYEPFRQDGSSIFINPPYSKSTKDHDGIDKFVRKAWEDAKHFRVVMLLKADMSTGWFNYPLMDICKFDPPHEHELNGSIYGTITSLLEKMKYQKSPIGVYHFRNRIKFYVSEEVLEEDAKKNGHKFKNKLIPATINNGECSWDLMETKNYKRVEDGIVSKSGANFPSMIMILDRREGR